MTKDQLISAVQNSLQETTIPTFDKSDIKAVVEHTLANIQNAVANGDEVTLRGFGTFKIKRRAAKAARNIKLNKTILVPARNVVAFKPSKDFTVAQD